MSAGVSIRALSTIGEAREAAALIDRVWGEERIVTPALLLAVATHGGEVLAAFEGDRMVGVQLAFVGTVDGELLLHSHITGIERDIQRRGVGFELKRAQREWCLRRGIEVVTWTFDPMLARNARFNLRKLGAVAVGFARDLYGPMGDAMNAGDRTDRLEVRWELRSPRVAAAFGEPSGGATAEGGTAQMLVRIPEDYLALRARDPEGARRERDRVAEALDEALLDGFVAVDFTSDHAYVLRPR